MSPVSDFISPEVKQTPTRFRNPLGKFRISIQKNCDNCGLCLKLCPHGVYQPGSKRPKVSKDYLCLGPACQKNEYHCVARCPKEAILLNPNPSFEVLGDNRWTADLLASTWYMAESGEIPYQGLNYKTGGSGGGFDKLRLVLPPKNQRRPGGRNCLVLPPEKSKDGPGEEISLTLELNRTGDERPRVTLPVPFYLGECPRYGGSASIPFSPESRAATAWGTFCCTGEGLLWMILKPSMTTSSPSAHRPVRGAEKVILPNECAS